MVSGFLISPNDQERIFSGEASEMRIWSKVGAATTGLKIFRTSWFIGYPVFQCGEPPRKRVRCPGQGARDNGDGGRRTYVFSSSTFRPSERISFISTLKLSGMPASKV